MERGRIVKKVEEELDEHTEPEHRRRFAEDDEPTRDPNELVVEQRRETGEMGGLPTTPLMSGSQGRGALGGAALGAVVGAVLLSPFALIPFFDLEPVVRLAVVMVAGAAGGAVAAAVYFGGRAPELRGESIDADNTPSSGSSLAGPGTEDRGRRPTERARAELSMSDPRTNQMASTQGSTSLTETLEEFRQMGFPTDFTAREGGILVCAECHQTFDAAPDSVSGERRLEGASDPDDMQLVVALICPVCGAHGTAIAHYGPMSDAASQDLVTALSAGDR